MTFLSKGDVSSTISEDDQIIIPPHIKRRDTYLRNKTNSPMWNEKSKKKMIRNRKQNTQSFPIFLREMFSVFEASSPIVCRCGCKGSIKRIDNYHVVPKYIVKHYSRTQEHINKIKIYLPKAKYGTDNPLYGKKHTKDSKQKMSQGHKKTIKNFPILLKEIFLIFEINPKFCICGCGGVVPRLNISRWRINTYLPGHQSKKLDRNGAKNGMYGMKHTDKTRKLMSEKKKKFLLENPEKHPSVILKNNNKISKGQKKLYSEVKKYYSSAVLNMPIGVKDTLYFLDVAIPELKIDLEYDGKYWHSFKKCKIRDKIRDINMESIGWSVIRIPEEKANKFDARTLTWSE